MQAAGDEVYRRLAAAGQLDPTSPAEAGINAGDRTRAFAPELARDNAALDQVIYGERMLGLSERIFGGQVRHFDYT